jgi:nitroreductase
VRRLRGDSDLLYLRTAQGRTALARFRLLRRVYLASSSAFGREARSVLAGIAAPPAVASSASEKAYHRARRSAHRLEKGIISRPRRPVFGREYVPPLVRSLVAHGEEWTALDPAGVRWFTDVLDEYFSIVDLSDSPALADAASAFRAWIDESSARPPSARLVPTDAAARPETRITIDDLHTLAIRRRSVRWFDGRRVPREVLDRAIEVGGLAPSACNRQPFRFHVADDPEVAAELGGLAMGTVGFAQQFPCVIAVVGDQAALVEVRDRHLPYIDSSLAVMGLLFALEVQGLSACTINWPDIGERDAAIRRFLDLRPSEQTVMLIAVGYADPTGGVPASAKKPLSMLRRYVDAP